MHLYPVKSILNGPIVKFKYSYTIHILSNYECENVYFHNLHCSAVIERDNDEPGISSIHVQNMLILT